MVDLGWVGKVLAGQGTALSPRILDEVYGGQGRGSKPRIFTSKFLDRRHNVSRPSGRPQDFFLLGICFSNLFG